MSEINPKAIAKFIKNWRRGVYSQTEAYFGLIENGVSPEDAKEITSYVSNPEQIAKLMEKYS